MQRRILVCFSTSSTQATHYLVCESNNVTSKYYALKILQPDSWDISSISFYFTRVGHISRSAKTNIRQQFSFLCTVFWNTNWGHKIKPEISFYLPLALWLMHNAHMLSKGFYLVQQTATAFSCLQHSSITHDLSILLLYFFLAQLLLSQFANQSTSYVCNVCLLQAFWRAGDQQGWRYAAAIVLASTVSALGSVTLLHRVRHSLVLSRAALTVTRST